jgi:hypothetical protein
VRSQRDIKDKGSNEEVNKRKMKYLRRPVSALNIGVPAFTSKGNTTVEDLNKKWDKTFFEENTKNEINLDLLFEKQLQKLREINKEYDDEILNNNKNGNNKIIFNENTYLNLNVNTNDINSQHEKKCMDTVDTIINHKKKNIFRSPSNYGRNNSLLPKITLSPRKLKNITRDGTNLTNKKIITRNISFNCRNDRSKMRPFTSKSPLHKEYGKVPKYLQEIKKNAEILKEIEKKKKEEEKYPKGTRLLPEEERLLTLHKLEESKKELENLIEKLPITLNSLSLKKKQEKLYKELDEVEKAIIIFSKDQVFVKIDS